MENNMSDARKKLETWFLKADNWQKDLFINIWNGGMAEDELLDRAIKLIRQEYLCENHKLAATVKFPEDITFADTIDHPVKLVSISDIKGVGALAPQSPLSFGNGLTVVYGDNGCGKSSYVRILKALANPINANAVFGNVFQANNVSPESKITFSVDGVEKSVVWNKTSKKPYPIQIYDTMEADRFVNQKNEIIFEPKVLDVITRMVTIYDLISSYLAETGKSIEREMGQPPQELGAHSLAADFTKLSTLKSLDNFAEKYIWTETQQQELAAVTAGLQENNPMRAAKAKEAQRDIIRNHGYEILKLLAFISDEARNEYLEKREKQISAKKTADLLVSASRGQSLLNDFGSDIWKDMWARAIAYIRTIEDDAEFPVTATGRCALCQQELDAETVKRMQMFKEFSESSATKEAAAAHSSFEIVVKRLQDNVENKVNISEIKKALEAGAIPEEVQKVILSIYETIRARCDWLLSYSDDTETEIPYMQSRDEITSVFKGIVDKISLEIRALQEASANREKSENRLKELLVIQWVHGNLVHKKHLICLREMISKCKTNSLTTLKKDLSKLLITDAYIQRFQEEMNYLDTRKQVKVELIAISPQKGKSYHQVCLKGACSVGKHKNNEILSEGEFRVVSLASFLADLSSWHRDRPFIFDDPITSLDHLYEENVARRLIRLSTERQVIVFTHRLAFAQLLQTAVADFNAEAAYAEKLERANVTHIELRNSPLGEPSLPSYVSKMKLGDATKKLLGDDVVKIKKLQKEGDFDSADAKILSLCMTFRNVIEYGVEQNLLSGIISRFGRNVSSMKLPCLCAITQDDVALFHGMMTKYSYYDHSHSIELPITLPDIATIEADLVVMQNWAKQFAKRCEAEQDKAKGKK